jgi:diguanylate cyclase (GGDEF)-like protein/PAS domain S-box-containing protein
MEVDVRDFSNFSRDDLLKALQQFESAAEDDEGGQARLLYELPLYQIELEIQNRELVDAQREIEKARDRYTDLYDFAPVGYLSLNHSGIIGNINLTGCQMLGKDRAALLDLPFTRFLAVDDRRRFFAMLKRLFVEREPQSEDYQLEDPMHQVVQVECRVHADHDGEPTCLAVLTNVTRRKFAEDELRRERSFLQHLIDGIDDPILVIGTDHKILRLNEAARRTVYKSPVVNYDGHPTCYQVYHQRATPCEAPDLPCPLKQVLQTRRPTKVIHTHADENGAQRRIEVSASPLEDDEGNVIGVIEVNRDITDQLALLDELSQRDLDLAHQAQHDSLTGLPNRVLFADRLTQAIHVARRNGNQIAVLFIDLDRFKEINDSFDHGVGDSVLMEVATRFRQLFREEDTIARMGGDEFTVILNEIAKATDAAVVAKKILSVFDQPFELDQRRLYLGASIGISLYPDNAQTVDELIRNADAAMYEAKARGRKAYRFYAEEMTERAFDRMALGSALYSAIDSDDFVLHYQPQCELASGRLIGVEALVRWQRGPQPDDLLQAYQFINIAEQSGLIVRLDRWVLHAACEQMQRWIEAGTVADHIPISINLSGKSFDHENVADMINKMLLSTGLAPDRLEIEVTESTMMRNVNRSAEVLSQLRAMGVKVAVDDFGTGYSSLAYLKKLPLTRLKIDRIFTADLPDSEGDVSITDAIIGLAGSLGLDVIAEGIETEQQRSLLENQGCRYGQGYLFAKPMPADAFEQFVDQ